MIPIEEGLEGGGGVMDSPTTVASNVSSSHPPWVADYIECGIAVSHKLNLMVDDGVWWSLLQGDENSTALGTMVMEAAEVTTYGGIPASTIAPFFHNDTIPHYRTSAMLGAPTESSFRQDSYESALGGYDETSTAMPLPSPSPATSSIPPMSFNDTEELLGIIDAVARWCLAEVTPHQRPYLLAWWQQALWMLAFGLMLFVAIGGNALVMWIVTAHKRMRTVTNYFLMNLSAADLLMSVLNCMFNFIYMLHSDWPFGAVYCTISNFMANITIAASVFTLMAISFDRYIAIVRPLEPRMSKSTARCFIFIIWIVSVALAIPCALYSTTVTITYKDDKIRRGCILQWPDGQTSASKQEHIYNIVFFITTYLLPMVMMLASYSLISKELWGSQHIGELTERQVNVIRSKRRVVRMFIVIVVIFAICWLPQQAFFLYQYHNSQVLDTAHVQHIYLAFYWLAMTNAMVNPIIYYWMNARFRSYFREVIRQLVCLRFCCPRSRRRYTASPVLERRGIPNGQEEASSRSRSDSRGLGNGTVRTLPGSMQYRQHTAVRYCTRDRHLSRNGLRQPITSGQCEICLQSFKPTTYESPSGIKSSRSGDDSNMCVTTQFGADSKNSMQLSNGDDYSHGIYNQRSFPSSYHHTHLTAPSSPTIRDCYLRSDELPHRHTNRDTFDDKSGTRHVVSSPTVRHSCQDHLSVPGATRSNSSTVCGLGGGASLLSDSNLGMNTNHPHCHDDKTVI